MYDNQCKAITKSGEQCKLKAGPSGFCHIHVRKVIQYEMRTSSAKNQETGSRRFSQRKGFKPVLETIQVDGMNDDLRNSIWNILMHHAMRQYYGDFSNMLSWKDGHDDLAYHLWTDFFKKPVNLIPDTGKGVLEAIYEFFSSCEWYEVYDFVEYVLNYVNRDNVSNAVNEVLERELSGYRFIGGVITEITDEQEINMLESALADEDFPSVREHLKRALEFLSDRESPDYRNSIKESISAVESLAQIITGNQSATLGSALKEMERSERIKLHPTLSQAYRKLYGYTSDEGGIRHAMLREPDLSASDAKFFLLICTSFINYLKSKL